jgi:peptide/nickel transport system substrate-binding protein
MFQTSIVRRRALRIASVVAIGALLAACGSSSSPSAASGSSSSPGAASGSGAKSSSAILNVALGGPHNPITQNFNPFLPTSALSDVGSTSLIYEPLLQYNMAATPDEQPWLAKSYAWSDNDKTLTFNLRPNVKWSDGKPFTSADVVFTFDLIKKYPALNSNGIVFKSVTAPSKSTVVFRFATPEGPEIYYIAGETYIVPQHLWASVANPTTYADKTPVGTGPFLLKSASASLDDITFVKNSQYWQPGKPAVKEIRYNVYNSNTGVTQALQDNAVDWGSAATTQQIIKSYTSSSPNHHFSIVSIPLISYLYPNLEKYPTNILAVREAISDAVSHQELATIGESGLMTPATSPTGLVLPLQKQYLDPKYAGLTYKVNDAAAKAVLEKAGFKMSNGVFAKDGKPLDITLITPGGYTDYVSDAQIMEQELKSVGISMTIDTTSVGAYTAALDDGTFSVSLNAPTYGPTPYYSYNSLFNTTLGAPIGKAASNDFERWTNKETDAMLLTAAKGGSAAAKAYDQLEQIMVQQLPVIPMLVRANDAQYNTTTFTGFPTATANRYDGGGPDEEVAVLAIHPN